jgi:hypothetical protein
VLRLNVEASEKLPVCGSKVPFRNKRLKPPITELPCVKVSE